MNVAGKRVLVTGGGSGYGYGIAKVLAKAGAQIWISGRDEAKLNAAAAELGVQAIRADVTSGADWDRVMDTIGDLDVLVNNAGAGGHLVAVAEQSDADIAATIATNLTGVIMGSSSVSLSWPPAKRIICPLGKASKALMAESVFVAFESL